MDSPQSPKSRRIPLPRRWWGWLAIAGVAAVAVAVPVAWATHQFADVPTASPHHDTVSAIATAGITGGCAPGLYCPANAVRRDEMASFLSRGLGRLNFDSFEFPASGNGATLASTTVRTEGTEYIVARASFYVFIVPQAAGVFPCERSYFLSVDGVDGAPIAWMRRNASPVVAHDLDNMAPQGVFRVTTSGNHTVQLKTGSSPCAVQVGRGNLVAEVVPFNSLGLGATPIEPAVAGGTSSSAP